MGTKTPGKVEQEGKRELFNRSAVGNYRKGPSAWRADKSRISMLHVSDPSKDS